MIRRAFEPYPHKDLFVLALDDYLIAATDQSAGRNWSYWQISDPQPGDRYVILRVYNVPSEVAGHLLVHGSSAQYYSDGYEAMAVLVKYMPGPEEDYVYDEWWVEDEDRLSENPLGKQFDDFTIGYLEAALWSSTDNEGEPLDKKYGIDDIAPSTLRQVMLDTSRFQEENWDLLRQFDMSQAGHDFWLTRNHHGAGFWDGDYPEPFGTELTKSSHKYPEVDLYVGDDGLIYS